MNPDNNSPLPTPEQIKPAANPAENADKKISAPATSAESPTVDQLAKTHDEFLARAQKTSTAELNKLGILAGIV